ncbi:MAG TPA: hypothetical protein VM328_09410, partial [Fimbriimonadaceae bacterium]|nr:hypothetical protein [Fimbriimonadaceae bacterium]
MNTSLTRRELLAGAGALALSPGILRIRPREKPVGWAILGIGSYARNQIMPSFAACKHAKLVGLISGTPSKLETFGEQYGIPKSHRY